MVIRDYSLSVSRDSLTTVINNCNSTNKQHINACLW